MREALKLCEKGLIFKTRSDAVHNRNPFEIYQKIEVEEGDLKVLQNKVFISSIMSIDPYYPIGGEYSKYRLFSPSDWMFLGLYEDVKEWFNIEEQSKQAIKYAQCCEQIFCLSNFMKCKSSNNFNFQRFYDEQNQKISLDFILSNLKITQTNKEFKSFVQKYNRKNDSELMWIKA